MNQIYSTQIQQLASTLPPTKLDPDLKNISGNRVALSSLKGKYVLLSFWSAKSQECIAENLQLKELYKLYNKKGFEIYQINLDENESDWETLSGTMSFHGSIHGRMILKILKMPYFLMLRVFLPIICLIKKAL